ncbi:MAG: hypothetical protein ACXVHQ_39065 [Solirubrobacteraceae bacterium]
MANMRRRTPEPPPGPPEVHLTPGLADQTLHELAPLLAEEASTTSTSPISTPSNRR